MPELPEQRGPGVTRTGAEYGQARENFMKATRPTSTFLKNMGLTPGQTPRVPQTHRGYP